MNKGIEIAYLLGAAFALYAILRCTRISREIDSEFSRENKMSIPQVPHFTRQNHPESTYRHPTTTNCVKGDECL